MSGYAGPRRVLSGVQPSGGMHLGNYLGALVNFVAMQKDYQCFYMIADLHALMQPFDPKKLREQTFHIAASFIACGIDPLKSTIFAQSNVRAHAELGWIFQGVARLGWLDRMTQFKDKAGKNAERAAVGLYTYPVLQAADILVYKATHVPVGEDQKQHLELSRDIAGKFNHDFEAPDFFPLPQPLIQGPGARVMSLRDGTKKMSKSDASEMASVFLADDADTIAKKIKKATTDPEPLPSEELGLEGRAEAANLVGIYAALSGKTRLGVLAEFGGKGFGAFKPALAELVIEKIGPIGAELRRLEADPGHLGGLLKASAERAAQVADPVVLEVKKIVGLAG